MLPAEIEPAIPARAQPLGSAFIMINITKNTNGLFEQSAEFLVLGHVVYIDTNGF
jgi:hypothetical protein